LAAPFSREARIESADSALLVTIARELAWCSSDVLRLNPTPTATQQEESRRYADEAMTILKLAKSGGLKDPKAITGDAAFNHLKTRDDFMQLLSDLGQK